MFLGQDLPDGNYKLLHTSGQLEKKNAFQTQMLGCKNYRMWCMVATYGFCFGVELTMNNIVAGYLYDQFELDLVTAGTLASCYGLMNLFAARSAVSLDYLGQVRHARSPLVPLAVPDPRGRALHLYGSRQELPGHHHSLHGPVLHLRAGLRGRRTASCPS